MRSGCKFNSRGRGDIPDSPGVPPDWPIRILRLARNFKACRDRGPRRLCCLLRLGVALGSRSSPKRGAASFQRIPSRTFSESGCSPQVFYRTIAWNGGRNASSPSSFDWMNAGTFFTRIRRPTQSTVTSSPAVAAFSNASFALMSLVLRSLCLLVLASIEFVVEVDYVRAIDLSCWRRCRKMPMSAMSMKVERMSMTAVLLRLLLSFR